MKWEVITPPAVEPVTFSDAKAHLRLDGDEERALIQRLIIACRNFAETETQRSLITRTMRASFTDSDCRDSSGLIALPRGPVQSITSVQDRNGTLDASAYAVRRLGTTDCLWVKSGAWPVVVTYVAGYGDNAADVPPDVTTAILMHVAHMHRQREAMTDRQQQITGFGLEAIYGQYRPWGHAV